MSDPATSAFQAFVFHHPSSAMPCSICYDEYTAPVALPCGHIFCRECVRRTVDAIKLCSVEHFCPTCRTPYSVVGIDPALIPPYLRPHTLPSIRPVFFDHPSPRPACSSSSSSATFASSSAFASSSSASRPALCMSALPAQLSSALGRAAAEADALRLNATTWKRRAEVHAAANAGLLSFARVAKENAVRMRAERDVASNCCELLKGRLRDIMSCPKWKELEAELCASSLASPNEDPAADDSHPEMDDEKARNALDVDLAELSARAACSAPTGLPVFFIQPHVRKALSESPRSDLESPSLFGPPIKRRKVHDDDAPATSIRARGPGSRSARFSS
ncbi:unnamed protein product [Mycena citricolor]|uniref:RING-type domain-containing protein n=1 Tax=Mycena citricolor TaxID=2018698 RepID=A0AAD2GUX8_9AGAR|nr:unnamed protein product [Mycena citricolor]